MASEVTLVIGGKRGSSWSLCAWLFLQHHGVAFRERALALDTPEGRAQLQRLSPSARVPLLLSSEFAVWESLAICEFAAEWFALPAAWPMTPSARAMARAVALEMHAGFAHLRRELPFDAARTPRPAALSAPAQAESARVCSIWRTARARCGSSGPWLFGQFGIADAMFAPMALRFHQYAIPMQGPEREYVELVLDHHAVQAWMDSAQADPVSRLELPAAADADPTSIRSVTLHD
ncbi:glutathione S-transferase [Panacagrimonas sp.]|uniref:glutathione S-transferase n=1 Tax=Panacagrimonas sp. TaxID=2480088 RepID=UPI003B51C01E